MEDLNQEVLQNLYESLRNVTYQSENILTSFKNGFKINSKVDRLITDSINELIQTLQADLIVSLDIIDSVLNAVGDNDIQDLLGNRSSEIVN